MCRWQPQESALRSRAERRLGGHSLQASASCIAGRRGALHATGEMHGSGSRVLMAALRGDSSVDRSREPCRAWCLPCPDLATSSGIPVMVLMAIFVDEAVSMGRTHVATG